MKKLLFSTALIISMSASSFGQKQGFEQIEIEVYPEYPGGLEKLYSEIANSIEFPKSAKQENIEGYVYVEFIVEADGKVTSPKIVKSLHPDCDKVAISVFKEMPNWIPGVNKGKNVKTKMVIPIKFKLD